MSISELLNGFEARGYKVQRVLHPTREKIMELACDWQREAAIDHINMRKAIDYGLYADAAFI